MIFCKVHIFGSPLVEAIDTLSNNYIYAVDSIPNSISNIQFRKRFRNLNALISKKDCSNLRNFIRFIQFSYNNFSTIRRMLLYQFEILVSADSWENGEPVILDSCIWAPRSAFKYGLVSRDMSEHHEYDLNRKPEVFRNFLIPISGNFSFANHRKISSIREPNSTRDYETQLIHGAEIAHGFFVLKSSNLLNIQISHLDYVKSIYFENISEHDGLLSMGSSRPIRVEKAVFAGSNSNWWHFISEICVSLVLSESSKSVKQPLILQAHLPPQIIELATTITGESPLLVESFSHLYVDELLLLANLKTESGSMSEDWRHGMRNVRELVLSKYGTVNTSSYKKIFVPRSASTFRRLVNQKEIAKYLVREGFTIVHPEELTLAHQINVFSGAVFIVIESGAAMANLLFAPYGAKIVELQPSVGELNFWRDVMKMMEFEYLVVKGTTKRFSRRGIASDSYVISIENLRRVISI